MEYFNAEKPKVFSYSQLVCFIPQFNLFIPLTINKKNNPIYYEINQNYFFK
jgi:hypothetical protein